jgi:DNA-binding CsgD family transcriptional regulator
MDKGHRKWTAREERRLFKLRAAGKSTVEIAKRLRRTESAVSNRITLLRRHRIQTVAEGRLRRG